MSKRIRLIFLSLICVLMLSGLAVSAQAEDLDQYDLELERVDVDELSERFRKTLIISDEEITHRNINNFDVDENGNVIICLNENLVNVYNDPLEFMYSISYDPNSTSDVFWYDGKAAVYVARDGQLILLDENGISDAFNVTDSINNSKILRKVSQRRSIESNGYTYKATYSSSFQKFMSTSPTKLVRINDDGEKVIYENKRAAINIIIIFGTFVFIVFLFVGFVRMNIKNAMPDEDNQRSE